MKVVLRQIGDIGYQTVYEAGNDPVDPRFHNEAFGFRAWMNTSFTLDLEVLQFYRRSITFSLNVFDITPYKQTVSIFRPAYFLKDTVFDQDNNRPDYFDVKLIGSYSVNFLQLRTFVSENAKTLKYSLVDVLENPHTSKPYPESTDEAKAALAYNGLYESPNEDLIWNIDFLKVFGIDFSSNRLYGANRILYRLSVLHEEDDDNSDEVIPYLLDKYLNIQI